MQMLLVNLQKFAWVALIGWSSRTVINKKIKDFNHKLETTFKQVLSSGINYPQVKMRTKRLANVGTVESSQNSPLLVRSNKLDILSIESVPRKCS